MKKKKENKPYSQPKGWESLNDDDIGIVYVLSGSNRDAIVIKKDNNYLLFTTDKHSIKRLDLETFDKCITTGDDYVKETSSNVWDEDRLIGKMQIKKLSPKYPTMTLTWHSANCIICWETWREVILNEIQSK